MSLFKKLATAVATFTLASSAQAGLIIDAIDMLMVDTNYNSRSPGLPAGLSPEDAALAATINGILAPAADAGNIICEQSLDALVGITAHGTCGSDRRNIGSLYLITGYAETPAEVQFGMDWGRGGFSGLNQDGLPPLVTRYDTDIWWANNWSHGDVFSLNITSPGEFAIGLVGFEGCCDGNNSARWRAGDGEWHALAVNGPRIEEVPAPQVLPLAAMGLLALGLVRRRKTVY